MHWTELFVKFSRNQFFYNPFWELYRNGYIIVPIGFVILKYTHLKKIKLKYFISYVTHIF